MGGGRDQAQAEADRLKEERKRLEQQRRQTEAENKRKADADKRRRLGRSSLITNLGGELGIEDNLG